MGGQGEGGGLDSPSKNMSARCDVLVGSVVGEEPCAWEELNCNGTGEQRQSACVPPTVVF